MRHTTNKTVIRINRKKIARRTAAAAAAVLLTMGAIIFIVSNKETEPLPPPDPFAEFPLMKEILAEEGFEEGEVIFAEPVLRNGRSEELALGGVLFMSLDCTLQDGSHVLIDGRTVLTDAGGLGVLRDSIIVLDREGTFTVTLTAGDMVKECTFTVSRQKDMTDKSLLINKLATVDRDFVAGELEVMDDMPYIYGTGDEVSYMETEAMYALYDLIQAAKADGYYIYALSGHRGWDLQQELYDRAGGDYQNGTAKPGTSEHQSGLAMDVVWDSHMHLSQSMLDDPEFAWMTENSWKYGYILRYPYGWEDVTGYDYEPWHYRYIGKDAAREYHESGASTFEEFSADRMLYPEVY